MRVLFFGNIADYSPGFLDALVCRAIDPADQLSIAAVVCPAARPGRAGTVSFTAKRRLGDVFDRLAAQPLPTPMRSRLSGTGGGVHRQMQRLAHRAGAPIRWPTSLQDDELTEFLAQLDADIGIVAGLDRIVREPLLSAAPPLYNVHPSLLPEFRGPTPEFWQLDQGATRGGATVHRIDPGVDTGPIVSQGDFTIDPWLDADGLIARSVEVGTRLVDELIDSYPTVVERAREQGDGTYQPVPGPSMTTVPYERTAHRAFDRARAFGFDTPLAIHVPAAAWQAGRDAAASTPDESTTMLELYEPVPHVDAPNRTPGLVAPTSIGGAVIWCASGVLEFRRVVALPSPPETWSEVR